jgi:hypothetical protein
MRKACLVVAPPYVNDQIFNKTNLYLNRDNCLVFFHLLQDYFLAAGVQLSTQDINDPSVCDFIIYNEMPAIKPQSAAQKKTYLLLFESELIRPDNWDLPAHKKFLKIFTWHDDFIDNRRYYKMNFTHSGSVPFLSFDEKSKFCTLIAGDKRLDHPLELYSQRRETIRWFEKNHPEDFEFFGLGWNQFTFQGPKFVRALNKLPLLRNVLAEKWPSYRGKLESKLSTLSQYKFSICYENARDIPGYITEKIFDSMAAGCIPVYWGASNISEYIPESCFVDRRMFKTYEDMYSFLTGMTASEYNDRLREIQKYLSSPRHDLFSPHFMAKYISEAILSGAL